MPSTSPFIIDLFQDCAKQADYRGSIGEDTNNSCSAFYLLVNVLQRIGRMDPSPVVFWVHLVDQNIIFRFGEQLGCLWVLVTKVLHHPLQVDRSRIPVWLVKDQAHSIRHSAFILFGYVNLQVKHEMDTTISSTTLRMQLLNSDNPIPTEPSTKQVRHQKLDTNRFR